MPTNEIQNKMIRPESYHGLFEVRAAQPEEGEAEKAMIIEGRAITFNDETILFHDKWENKDIVEKIDPRALDEADMTDVFLKYNHSDQIMVMARTKNNTLGLTIKQDGLYVRCELANTTAGRDLYELVKRQDIDKMSFAFSIAEQRIEEYEDRDVYTIMKIRKLYDVAAVATPAYGNTELYARRLGDVEARRAEVEAKKEAELKLLRQRAMLK